MKESTYREISRRMGKAVAGQRMLAIVVAASLAAMLQPAAVRAQETSGYIFGWGPAGQTVTVKGLSGPHRHITIGDSGRYSLRRLPLGSYTVTLEKDGKPVDVRHHITLKVGGGAEIDFACPDDHCEKQPVSGDR